MNYEYAFKRNTLGRTATCCALVLEMCIVVLWNCCRRLPMAVRLACLVAVALYPMSFLKVALSDPGRLRRRSKCPCGGSTRMSDGVVVRAYPEQYTRDIIVVSREGSRIYRQHLCPTCLLYKPSHTAHCSECGCCLLEKDHHCYWVANCIGRNNFRPFLVFVLSACAMFFISGRALRNLLGGWRGGRLAPYPLYSAALLTGAFFLYYLILGAFGLTSREYLNGKRQGFVGWARLWRAVLSSRPPVVAAAEPV